MRGAPESFDSESAAPSRLPTVAQRVAYDWPKEPLDGGTPACPHDTLGSLSILPNNLARIDTICEIPESANFNVLISNIEANSIELREILKTAN